MNKVASFLILLKYIIIKRAQRKNTESAKGAIWRGCVDNFRLLDYYCILCGIFGVAQEATFMAVPYRLFAFGLKDLLDELAL